MGRFKIIKCLYLCDSTTFFILGQKSVKFLLCFLRKFETSNCHSKTNWPLARQRIELHPTRCPYPLINYLVWPFWRKPKTNKSPIKELVCVRCNQTNNRNIKKWSWPLHMYRLIILRKSNFSSSMLGSFHFSCHFQAKCGFFIKKINKYLILFQVPKYFGLDQIFCARPKIHLNVVPVSKFLHQTKR